MLKDEREVFPKGWFQIKLSELITVTRGRSYRSAELRKSQNALVTLKSFQQNGGYRSGGLKSYTGPFKNDQIIKPGEIIIAQTDVAQKGYVIGRPAIVPSHTSYDQLIASLDVAIIRNKYDECMDLKFLYYRLLTPDYIYHIKSHCKGVLVLHLSKNALPSFQLHLPPFKEQHRMVSKIESIFAQIDACQKRLEALQAKVQLGPASLAALKSSVLKQAFEGKLVLQDPKDEPAEVMLKKIHKGLEIDFKKEFLPQGWIVTTLESIAEITMGRSPPSTTYNKEKTGMPFYQGKADFGDMHPTARIWCDKPQTFAQKHDILMSVRAPVGSTNISMETCSIGRGLAAIRAFETISTMYLFYQLRHLENKISQQGTGTTFKAVTKNQVTSISIFVPPLNEQKRIVAKIESIFAKIDAQYRSLRSIVVSYFTLHQVC